MQLETVTAGSVACVVDELTYRSYFYNRNYSPSISPERWGKMFANVEAMEARYQIDMARLSK